MARIRIRRGPARKRVVRDPVTGAYTLRVEDGPVTGQDSPPDWRDPRTWESAFRTGLYGAQLLGEVGSIPLGDGQMSAEDAAAAGLGNKVFEGRKPGPEAFAPTAPGRPIMATQTTAAEREAARQAAVAADTEMKARIDADRYRAIMSATPLMAGADPQQQMMDAPPRSVEGAPPQTSPSVPAAAVAEVPARQTTPAAQADAPGPVLAGPAGKPSLIDRGMELTGMAAPEEKLRGIQSRIPERQAPVQRTLATGAATFSTLQQRMAYAVKNGDPEAAAQVMRDFEMGTDVRPMTVKELFTGAHIERARNKLLSMVGRQPSLAQQQAQELSMLKAEADIANVGASTRAAGALAAGRAIGAATDEARAPSLIAQDKAQARRYKADAESAELDRDVRRETKGANIERAGFERDLARERVITEKDRRKTEAAQRSAAYALARQRAAQAKTIDALRPEQVAAAKADVKKLEAYTNKLIDDAKTGAARRKKMAAEIKKIGRGGGKEKIENKLADMTREAARARQEAKEAQGILLSSNISREAAETVIDDANIKGLSLDDLFVPLSDLGLETNENGEFILPEGVEPQIHDGQLGIYSGLRTSATTKSGRKTTYPFDAARIRSLQGGIKALAEQAQELDAAVIQARARVGAGGGGADPFAELPQETPEETPEGVTPQE